MVVAKSLWYSGIEGQQRPQAKATRERRWTRASVASSAAQDAIPFGSASSFRASPSVTARMLGHFGLRTKPRFAPRSRAPPRQARGPHQLRGDPIGIEACDPSGASRPRRGDSLSDRPFYSSWMSRKSGDVRISRPSIGTYPRCCFSSTHEPDGIVAGAFSSFVPDSFPR